MALNPEPADPAHRQAAHLPPRSSVDAAEQILNGYGNGNGIYHNFNGIDEDSIKESPPRSRHTRESSEPRPIGEILRESEENLPQTATPTRVTRKPLPSTPQHDMSSESTNRRSKRALSHDVTEEFSGQGMVESPRSPTRKAHKRVSSRNLNGGLAAAAEINDGPVKQVVYEKYANGDGEHLVSVKPPASYEAGLRQDEIEKPVKHQRQSSKDEFVSGRQAGLGWHTSA